jgi:uncharacterized protein (TIGR03083 family)
VTTRTFAPWVEPIAAQLRLTRHEVVRAATQYLPEFWGWMSPLPGWTYKDLLAHLASGDWVLQTVLRQIIANQPIDVATVTNLDWVNAGNAQRVEERRGRTPEELMAEVEAESAETQELLSQLREEHEGWTQEGAPITLGQFLAGFPEHDRGHLAQLRVALESVML